MNQPRKPLTFQQRKAAVEKELSAYQRQAADLASADEIAKILKDESDRGVIVTYVSFIEDALVDRLAGVLGISTEARKKLAKGSGALSNGSAVAELAVAMGLIAQDAASTLSVLRMMRNACAHSRREISFDTPALKAAVGLLVPGSAGADPVGAIALTRQLARTVFIFTAGSLLSIIAGEETTGAEGTHLRRAVEVLGKLRAPHAASPRRSVPRQSRRIPGTS